MTLLTYPKSQTVSSQVKEIALKYAYTYIVQELLRLKHNEEGKKYMDGLITEAQWRDFLINWWNPRQETVIKDLLELRALCQSYISQFQDKIDLEGIPIG